MFELLDPEKAQRSNARLQRPWTVLTLGIMVPLGGVAYMAVTSANSRIMGVNQLYLVAGLAGLFVLLAGAYVFLGVRYNVAVARRVVGAIGGTLALAGVAVLVFVLYKYGI